MAALATGPALLCAQEGTDGPVASLLGDSSRDLVFTPVPRCRVIDTRVEGGRLTAGIPRAFDVAGPLAGQGGAADCQVPYGPATVVVLNVLAVQPLGAGTLAAWPFGGTMPTVTLVGYNARPMRGATGANANEVTLPLCDPTTSACTYDLNVQANGADTHLVADVAGYFSRVTGLTIPWSAVTSKPAGFDDDTDDTATYSAGAGLALSGTTFSVADLGVTAAKLGDGSVTSAKIANGTIALADLGQNGCSSNQVLKWNGSTWSCAADSDTNSGGTVTSVGAGAGLTGGPISTAGTLSVAAGGITASMIANGAVGLNQINTSQVQARLSGTCPVGQYLRGLNADGSLLCQVLVMTNASATVEDTFSHLGSHNSLAIGADGLPVIAYYDLSATALKVARCGNAACTVGNNLITVDNAADVGQHPAIATGADGLPVISYFDLTNFALKVAHCGNAACTSGTTITTVDNPTNQVGSWGSMAIGADGYPVISYYDQTAQALKVAHCGNAACSASNTVTTVDDPVNAVGAYTSIAVGTDGLPVISYLDNTADALKVLHCGNPACSASNTITVVDNPAANSVGYWTSIGVGVDGRPVVSYFDATANALKVARCGNAACSTGNTVTTVDADNEVGQGTSIAIGTDGLPIIAYYDGTASALKVAHCGNAGCTAGNTPTIVDNPSSMGLSISIEIGADGLPIVSYHDGAADSLRVVKCATRTCQ